MKTRRLPGTDLELSVVGFGAWAIGGLHWGDDVTDARSIAAVHAALDVGITWFDTAPIYGWGHSDEVLRDALGPRRKEVIVATKVGVGKGPDGHARSMLNPAHLRRDLEASLTRLDVDAIDLLQVHWPCQDGTPLEETFGALDALRREGKFRHLGVCNYHADALAQIAAITPIVSLQTKINLLDRAFVRTLRPTTASLGLGVLGYEPLARGLLTGKYARQPDFPTTDMRIHDDRFHGRGFLHAQRLTADLAKVARKVGTPTAALVVGWVAGLEGVTSVIAGAKDADQVRQNARAAALVDHPRILDVVSRIADAHGGTPPP